MSNNNYCSATRIMRLLHTGFSGTREEIAKRVFVSERTLDALLPKLHRHGLVRIIKWNRQVGKGAALTAVYGFGDGEPHATKPVQPKPWAVDARYSKRAQEALGVLMEYGEVQASDLMRSMNISRNYALQILATLRKQNLAHIGRYLYTGRAIPPIPMYRLGQGENVQKPAPFSSKELKIRRRRALINKHGIDLARRILRASDQNVYRIVVDGKTIYERG